MKFAILLLLVAFNAVAWGWDETSDGQPLCTHPDEMSLKYWRNHFDPTKYFECVTSGVPAEERICGTEQMFQPSLRICVPYLEWEWEENVDPPSKQ